MSYAENCLICGAPLEYLSCDEPMTCALCGKSELSKTRCTAGHYVCSDCHTQGMDELTALRGSEVHSTVILAHADDKLFGKLGTYVTCEPVFEEKKLYHGM